VYKCHSYLTFLRTKLKFEKSGRRIKMNKELPFEPFDNKGKVVCQICGKSFLVISPRHIAVHKIKYADYTKRYPTAPLSSDAFNVKSKYGKNSTLFVDDADLKGDLLDEEIMVDEEPELDDLEFENEMHKIMEEVRDPMAAQKLRVLDHLRLHFANIEKDYMVRHYAPNKNLIYEFVTDFCDPVLRVVIQFPNTFWHNNDKHIDPLKNRKLEEQNWKVLIVDSRAPTPRDIDKVIDSM
jgi:hypothetical protein